MIPFLWLFPPTIIVIVVGLTFLRPVLLRWTPAWASLILFLLAIAIATPMTWILVDWENPHLDIEHVVRIGTPLSVVLVPLVSFLVDCNKRARPRAVQGLQQKGQAPLLQKQEATLVADRRDAD